MARVTVEDCILNIPNRFDLVCIAGQRAKQIASGAPLTLDRDNDKDAVVALREIADRTVGFDTLEEEIVQSYQKLQAAEKPEFDMIGSGDADIKQFIEEEALQAGVAQSFEEEAGEGISFDDENMDVDD